MDTIFCMNCGRQLSEDALRCPDCGAPTLRGAGLTSDEAFETNEIAWLDEAPTGQGEPPLAPTTDAAAPPESERDQGPVPSVVSEVQAPITEEEWADRHGRPSRKSIAMIAAGVAAAILIVAGVVFAIGTGASKEPAASEQAAATSGEATTTDEGGSAGVEVRSGLADYSWPELSIIAREMTHRATREDALALATEYHLIDEQGHMSEQTKDAVITGVGPVPMRLADVFHDRLADGEGTAGLTFLSATAPISHQMKLNEDNIGGWEASQLRSYLSSEVLSSLEPELRSLIVTVDKRTNNVGQTTNIDSATSTLDMLWAPSIVEVCGQVPWEWQYDPDNTAAYNALLGAEGVQYACYAEMGIGSTEPNVGLMLAGAEGVTSWWTRSSCPSDAQGFWVVNEEGNPFSWSSAIDQRGVCFGFCL